MTLLDGQAEAKPKRKYNGRVGVFNWTPERVEEAKSLWADKWSAREIGCKFGISRNAVIGKFHRIGVTAEHGGSGPANGGWRARDAASPPAKRAKRATAIRNRERPGGSDGGLLFRLRTEAREPQLPEFKCPDDEPVSLNLSVFDLTDVTCRWPHGDEPFLFCGHVRQDAERPYCPFHNRLARGRQPPQYSEAERELRRRRALRNLAAPGLCGAAL